MQNNERQNLLLKIIAENWDAFKESYPSYNNAYYNKVVMSVLNCADLAEGFRQFFCLNCGNDDRIVAFS